MERNTFVVSTYIESKFSDVVEYLSDAANLAEYTLFSRMKEKVDDNTWLGSCSGYQQPLYYHVRVRKLPNFTIVEWHSGLKYGEYYHVYLMAVFKPSYFDKNASDKGTFHHWISYVDPRRRTPMIEQGLLTVHRSEARSLKGQLERRAGLKQPALFDHELKAHSIFMNMQVKPTVDYISSQAGIAEWGYMLYHNGNAFRDEYGHKVNITTAVHDLKDYTVIEYDTEYDEDKTLIRTPFILTPCQYAFAEPTAKGLIATRTTSWPLQGARTRGKMLVDDYNAELINAKRFLEAKAGTPESYALGCSYALPVKNATDK